MAITVQNVALFTEDNPKTTYARPQYSHISKNKVVVNGAVSFEYKIHINICYYTSETVANSADESQPFHIEQVERVITKAECDAFLNLIYAQVALIEKFASCEAC